MAKKRIVNLPLIIASLVIVVGITLFLLAPVFLGDSAVTNYALSSWILGVVAIVGFILIGRRIWWAWYVNIIVQIAWVIFWLIHGNLGTLVTNILNLVVFSANGFKWAYEYWHEQKNRPKNKRDLNSLIPATDETLEDSDVDGESMLD